MKPILLDTDILSFFLRNEKKNEKKATQKVNDYLKEHQKLMISSINANKELKFCQNDECSR